MLMGVMIIVNVELYVKLKFVWMCCGIGVLVDDCLFVLCSLLSM